MWWNIWNVFRKKDKVPDLPDKGVVTIVTAGIQQEVQGGGGCPGNNGPKEWEGQQCVGGEKREKDIPGMIALRPTEDTNQELQCLREPAEHRQVPETERQTDRYLRRTDRQVPETDRKTYTQKTERYLRRTDRQIGRQTDGYLRKTV